jgi:hypothetical protein
MSDSPIRKKGDQSKIEKHGVMEHAINLLKSVPKMYYTGIVEELNTIGNALLEDLILDGNISRFARSYPHFISIMKGKRENGHIVNGLLSGGMNSGYEHR